SCRWPAPPITFAVIVSKTLRATGGKDKHFPPASPPLSPAINAPPIRSSLPSLKPMLACSLLPARRSERPLWPTPSDASGSICDLQRANFFVLSPSNQARRTKPSRRVANHASGCSYLFSVLGTSLAVSEGD